MMSFPTIEEFVAGKPLQPDWQLESFFDLPAHDELATLQHTERVSAGLVLSSHVWMSVSLNFNSSPQPGLIRTGVDCCQP